MLRFGLPGKHQLDVLPLNILGTPTLNIILFASLTLKNKHTFGNRRLDARQNVSPLVGPSSWTLPLCVLQQRTSNALINQQVMSYDGYSSHLIIVDSASRQVWAFLTKTKELPINTLQAFLRKFGIGTGVIRTNQGGKLARSDSFCETMLKEFGYVVEPTGADSPSQNGGAESYNNTLAVKVRTLLYGAGLSACFWSAALLHAVYLHNRLVHSATGKTPFEGWYGQKSDITYLKTFGLRVCVK
jgi:hypothetical protein